MKDYKLSEIKAICEKHLYCHAKGGCPFYKPDRDIVCEVAELSRTPASWQIDEEEKDE